MTDHDAIAAKVRQDMKAGTPGPWQSGIIEDGGPFAVGDRDCWPICKMAAAPGPHNGANARRIAALPDLEAAYLDLYDEVQRLRAERDALISMRDSLGNFWAKAEARAEKAEAERIAEWNKRRDAESSLVLEKAVCLTAEAERDEWQEEVARCTLSCPPGFRKSPASDGVKALRAERDRLRAALNEIASAADGIAHGLQVGPEDEGRDIYEMALAIRDDASAALKGPEE